MANYKKTELAKMKAEKKIKSIGSVVQSPDQQYATGMMGKQPVAVYPAQGAWQKKALGTPNKKRKPKRGVDEGDIGPVIV